METINALLGPTYRLNLTFNTDFAQVEADRQQINLSRFPLFFPELREFFLEGDDFFDFGFGGNRIIPFYSRRIGLSESRETVPIIAGARILGKEEKTTFGSHEHTNSCSRRRSVLQTFLLLALGKMWATKV